MGMVNNRQVAEQTSNSACRVEVSFHDWDSNLASASHPWDAPACGFNFALINFGNQDIRLQIYSTQGLGGQVCLIRLGADANGVAVLPSKFATVRFQRVPEWTWRGRDVRGNGYRRADVLE